MLASFFAMAALLVEALTGVVKTTLTGFGLRLPDWVDQSISMALSIAIAVLGKMDFFALVSELTSMQFNLPPALGALLSALVLARGSNGLHDLLKKLNPNPNGMRIW